MFLVLLVLTACAGLLYRYRYLHFKGVVSTQAVTQHVNLIDSVSTVMPCSTSNGNKLVTTEASVSRRVDPVVDFTADELDSKEAVERIPEMKQIETNKAQQTKSPTNKKLAKTKRTKTIKIEPLVLKPCSPAQSLSTPLHTPTKVELPLMNTEHSKYSYFSLSNDHRPHLQDTRCHLYSPFESGLKSSLLHSYSFYPPEMLVTIPQHFASRSYVGQDDRKY